MADAARVAEPLAIALPDQPMQTWDDPARGSLRWQSLFSQGQTDSDSLTCGVAHMDAGDTFALHHHPQSEVYFGLSGAVEVLVNGQPFALTPGVALFIPGGAEHGIMRATEPCSWFYVFAADRFEQIPYSFVPVGHPPLSPPTGALKEPGEQE